MEQQKDYSPECGICPYCYQDSEDTAWIKDRQKCFCPKCHEEWRLPVEVLEDIELD